MLKNAIKEIKKIRAQEDLKFEINNSNEYRLLVKEKDGLTAYYFSCPIYRQSDRKLVYLNFDYNNQKYKALGSNCITEIQNNKINLKNHIGQISVDLLKNYNFAQKENYIQSENIKIHSTYNGIALHYSFKNQDNFKFNISTDKHYTNLRFNGNYLAFMQDEFIPFCTISCISVIDNITKQCYPYTISYRQNTEKNYTVLSGMLNTESNDFTVVLEISLYANKMIFDTTVESNNPDKNNAFGSVTFLGKSREFGEQWLYSRIDTMQLMDLNHYLVKEANLYLPKYSKGDLNIKSYKMAAPWCSFGSTWNTKVNFNSLLSMTRKNANYKIIDVTEVIRDILRLNEPRNPGVVIKADETASEYEVLATADNYFTPQILEIKLKNN